jgi:carboxypeptidase family protein/TonB-dependent receptor-like protein
MNWIYTRFIGHIAIMLLFSIAAWGSVTGSISGIVTDSSGAVVPKADVTVIEVNTRAIYKATTDSLGAFSFLALSVGQYQLEVKVGGFKSYQQVGIALNANDALGFAVALQVGNVTEHVEVSANAVHVETISTQSGDVIGGKKMESLPLNGRNYTDLLGLQPGVVPISASTIPGSGNIAATASTGNVSISGNRETANGFVVNGGNVEENRNNGAAIVPNLDSIAEFRVLTNAFDAEYGYYSGGMINVVTKSGTNEWHGSAFEFLRNDLLDARNYFDIKRGAFRQNQFGGTFGGKIVKNKLFFFVDYQGTRQTLGVSSGLVPVPSLAERGGDFSALVSSATGAVSGPFLATALSQRLGYTVSAGEPYFGSSCTSNAQCAFPNGIIPKAAWDPASAGMLQFVPAPNQGQFFVATGDDQHTRDDRGGVRIDYDSPFGRVSGYYFIGDVSSLNPFGSNNVPGFPTSNVTRSQQFNLGLITSLGSTAVNEFRFNFTRFVADSNQPSAGIGNGLLSQLGFAVNVPGGISPGAPGFEGVPAVSLNDFNFGAPAIVYQRFQGNPQVIENFSLVRGRHTIKVGAQDTLSRFIQRFPLVGGNGFVTFSGNETGNDFADYLIGTQTNFTQESDLYLYEYKNYAGLYAQDSWRATPNLTLNYGVRWDYIPSWTEGSDQKFTYALGQQSKVFPTAPAGVLYVGDTIPGFGKVPSTIAPTPKNNFSPRIGLAYSPSFSDGLLGRLFGGAGKTSIRASYGTFYTNIEGIQTYNSDPPPPYVVFTSFNNVFLSRPYTNTADGVIHPDPFPFVRPKPGSVFDFSPYLPISGFAAISVHNQTPYSENYQLNMQRQVGSATLVSLGYVGGQGHHLLGTLPINPGNAQLCLSLSQPSEVAPGTPTCGPFGEDLTYTRADGTKVVGTRGPFGNPGFSDNTLAATTANSTYNAFQASVQHTTGHLNFLVGYTYSKTMDNSSGFNNEPINFINPRLSRSLSNFDITHNFVVSYDYELPFNRLFGSRSPRLTSGWRMVGITRFTTGLPVTMANGSDGSLLGTFGSGIGPGLDLPNYNGGNLKFTDPRSGQPYFDKSLFSPEALGVLGDSNRRFFHGPGINNWDLGLIKDLKLTERVNCQFRAEFFNVFNHAQFNNPGGNITHPGTFGLVTSARDPRIGQVAIKFLF